MKRAEKHLQRETTISDKHAAVLKADTSDSKEILALKAELSELKAAQATVTATQGQGASRRFNHKRHLDGGARTADKAAVDACKMCGNRQPGRPCWKEGEKKKEQGLALLQETDSILATTRGSPTTNLPLLRFRPSRLPLLPIKNSISVSFLMSHPPLLLRAHMYIIKDILLPKTSIITSD
jgi:hypothetical protein